MLEFDATTHTYTNKGKKLVSVTQLLRVAGISPSYEFVNPDVLQASATKGTIVHKEIEDYNNDGDVGMTTELGEYIKYITENEITPIQSEVMVGDDDVAGQIDLIAKNKDGEYIMVDYKTTSTIHKTSVTWQESTYKYLWEKENPDKPIAHNYVFHFSKDGTLNVAELEQVSKNLIEKLIAWYKTNQETGETAESNPFKYEIAGVNGLALEQLVEIEELIASIKKQKDDAEKREKELKDAIMTAMKENGVTHYEDERIAITIKGAYSKETLDTKTLKKDHPEIDYGQYTKTTTVKESVLITMRGEK